MQPPLIGRQPELSRLHDRLEQARQGWGGRFALLGESGMGKSRLAAELGDEAARAGARVVSIDCRGSLLRPYEPLAELVRGLLEIDSSLKADAQRLPLTQSLEDLGLGQFESTFARLLRIEGSSPMPKAQASAVSLPPGALDFAAEGEVEGVTSTVHDLTSHIDLGDMLRILLEALAQPGVGILLIVDDLDEAPELTSSVLLDLLDGTDQSPILFLATLRPDASPELLDLFAGEVSLTIGPLTREQTMEMASAIFGLTWITKELSDVLWANTGGNPLLIYLLSETLWARDRISVRRDDGLGEISGDGSIPAYREIVVDRIRQVPPDQLKTLLHAVILGDGFRLGVLSAMHEQRGEDALLADLDLLIESGLLARVGKGRSAIYRFPHTLVRETLYETAPPERRAFLHTRAGDYYALPLAGRKLRLESAVHHYMRAGKTDRAVSVIETALNKARKSADAEHMIALYKEALKVTANLPDLGERHAQLAERLGDLLATSGDYTQAAAAYWQADPEHSTLEQRAKLAMALLALNPQQAVGLMSRLAGDVPPDYPNDLRWRLEAGIAWGHALLNRTYDAVRHSRDVLSTLSNMTGFGTARTLMRGMLGMSLYYHGETSEATPHLESARAGFGARADDQGVMFVNQVLLGMERAEITRYWLDLVLKPLVSQA